MFTLEKCCFCVPRRLGLVIFVCLRMIVLISALGFTISYMVGSSQNPADLELGTQANFLREVAIIVFIIVDSVSCGILIIAVKKSHLKLYKAFFSHSIMVIFIAIVYFVSWNHNAVTVEIPFERIVASTETIVLIILIQLYIIIVVRSEIVKIKNTQYWNPGTGANMLL